MEHNKSLNNITVSNLISLLNNDKLCAGVKMFASGIIPHVIQKVYDVNEIIKSPIQQKIFYRSSNCNLLLLGDDICCNCNAVQNYENKNQSKKKSCEPAKLKAPISVTSPNRLKLTLQMQRLENKRLVLEVNQLQTELQKSSVEISRDIHTDFIKILCDNLDK